MGITCRFAETSECAPFKVAMHNSTHKPLLNCYPNSADALLYLFKIFPVKFYGPNGKMETFAIFDDGSEVTLLEEVIADQLGSKGKQFPSTLQW